MKKLFLLIILVNLNLDASLRRKLNRRDSSPEISSVLDDMRIMEFRDSKSKHIEPISESPKFVGTNGIASLSSLIYSNTINAFKKIVSRPINFISRLFDSNTEVQDRDRVVTEVSRRNILTKDEFKPDYYNSDNIPDMVGFHKFTGLASGRNTCYANSALQLIFNAPKFTDFIENMPDNIINKSLLIKVYYLYIYNDSPNFFASKKNELIKFIMDTNSTQSFEMPDGSVIESDKYGTFSNPTLFLDLFFRHFLNNNISLTKCYQAIGIDYLNADSDEFDIAILNLNGNHFVIVFKQPDGSWTEVNDDKIINDSDILGNDNIEIAIKAKYEY